MRAITNVVGFDDAPFARDHRGEVLLVGTICSRTRLDGVVSGAVQRDGTDSTRRMLDLVHRSQFAEHVRAVLLQGIAVAGFNVVDLERLHAVLGVPVVAIARRPPDLDAMRAYLENRVRGWRRKWRLIRAAGPMEPMRGVWVQRVGISARRTERMLEATTLHGKIPEPLRLAHLIAGGVTTGVSRGRA